MRRNLGLMEGAFPGDEVRTAASNLEVNGNPFGLAFAGRGDWAEGDGVATLAERRGGGHPLLRRLLRLLRQAQQQVAKSFLAVCRAAGVQVGILGKEEKCCGEPLRKLGNEYLYQMMAAENIERIKGYGVKRIVTTCPHCFNTLLRDYQDLGLDIPVEHYSTFLSRLLAEGRLKLKAAAFRLHLSRLLLPGALHGHHPPAARPAPGGRRKDHRNGQAGHDSFCCGAGGGRILAEEKLGGKISEARVRMAADTGAPMLVSNCPFCLTMFEDGIKTGGAEGRLQARDLAEILAQRIAT